ncbi:hypothetical protein YOLOSWAG_111 [Erwinia phage vB_EamM_Yoloswag]|uniref:Uncharacterized protein n=1 Tax=Erwinia phage vB_EamM_Yoloswag TaxID=1958956 RepID=A0A1S6L348_9CAUD|nr:hypothetical protein HOR66_gp111 [Erwinia phage vB_EamM_Yoloswag]AQT28593.1 hypothetical protein YOLOSWAG_111 [Erwinia phage vB_EamM_Yoloswag]
MIDLSMFETQGDVPEDIQQKIVEPTLRIAQAIVDELPVDADTQTVNEILRRVLWSRNQLWHCATRSDADNLAANDCKEIVAGLSAVDDKAQATTEAISAFVSGLDELPERVDKYFGLHYLVGARDKFLKTVEASNV